MANADVILRVTSDCPLIDPDVCGKVIALRASSDADFTTNNMPSGFPVGLDCEAFTLDALERAEHDAIDMNEREHVTPWLRTSPSVRSVNLDGPGGRFVQQRWTLDYPEDYAFFAALFDTLPPPPEIPGWRNVFETVTGDAELSRLQEICRSAAVERQ
jgi:spore coat polysaccharide biosynthesis protein SpsF (cytidylyltransferase family)